MIQLYVLKKRDGEEYIHMDDFNPNGEVLMLIPYGRDNLAYYIADKAVILTKETFLTPHGLFITGHTVDEIVTEAPDKLKEIIMHYNKEALSPVVRSITHLGLMEESDTVIDQVYKILNKKQ